MDWASESLYGKAKLYARRAHDAPVESALFAFWMSLSLELLARSALARIHPVLLADPKEPDNLHYAFGITPKGVPKSIAAKALFARCSVFVSGFTDQMAGHCLIVADRRNSELHTGAAAFEAIENSKWLPASYEVIQVLLKHLKRDFTDFLGSNHGKGAMKILKGRRDTIKKKVQQKLAAARKFFGKKTPEWKAECLAKIGPTIDLSIKGSRLRKRSKCPACGNTAIVSGESVGRSPVVIDEGMGTMTREVRVLPNGLGCPFCDLSLSSYQELKEAGLGDIYKIEEHEDPMEFFGIDPEEIINDYFEDRSQGYENE